jgi:hypothetical protein
MAHRNPWRLWSGALAVVLGLAACTQQGAQDTGPVIEDRTFPLKPASLDTTAPFLRVHLEAMKVTQKVEQGTDNVVDAPKLSATLKVKNASADHALRLIGGAIQYLDAAGKPIQLAEGREEPRFQFYSYSDQRLDPGMETSQDLSVAFPATALKDKTLHEIRLQLDYIPIPYREEVVRLPVALEG